MAKAVQLDDKMRPEEWTWLQVTAAGLILLFLMFIATSLNKPPEYSPEIQQVRQDYFLHKRGWINE